MSKKTKLAPSLLQNEKRCYKSGITQDLALHHIYGGIGRRSKSGEWGCWVWLHPRWHTESPTGVHFDKEFDRELKAKCQVAFERKYGHEKFMEVFGKNYVEDGNNAENLFDREFDP